MMNMQPQQQFYGKNPYQAYREQGVMTANPVELIIMLYDGLKKQLVLAKRAITLKNNMDAAHTHLMKAQAIVSELLNSLDMSFSLSKDLMAIYEFVLRTLTEANTSKDVSLLEPVIEIMDDLRATWQQVSELQKGHMYLAEDLKEE